MINSSLFPPIVVYGTPNGTTTVKVNPLSQVAVGILYGERKSFVIPADKKKRQQYFEKLEKERLKQWKWETSASDADLDKAEQAEEDAPNYPEAEMIIDGPDPQFGSAADQLEAQLREAGIGEIVKLPLGRAADLKPERPLAAVLVISHGTKEANVIPYTYLQWKYFTRKYQWRQWRDRTTDNGLPLDELVPKLRISRNGLLVLYGCAAADIGTLSQRKRIAKNPGITIAGWPDHVEWEVPGNNDSIDRRAKEAWNRLSFKEEEAQRSKLKTLKANLMGTGHARPKGSTALKTPGDLAPPGITRNEDIEELGYGNVITLVQRAAAAVRKELIRQAESRRK